MRVHVADASGVEAQVEDMISLRLDDRPALDILFQTTDWRKSVDPM
ncbi:MAG: hypothetical protein O3A46_02385 [Candidatus Poribacteria bacterium]|nr:hypothetical protein [Candidatus Poribacteria bacterium]